MKVKHGRETITTKVAYIAGFFDGEGCVRIKQASQGGNSYYVWVAITNSNKDILDEIVDLFGGKVRKAEKTVNKVIYHYLITGAEAVDFLQTLTPFLRDKLKQAHYAISFHQRKGAMDAAEKRAAYVTISAMKRGTEIIGNI